MYLLPIKAGIRVILHPIAGVDIVCIGPDRYIKGKMAMAKNEVIIGLIIYHFFAMNNQSLFLYSQEYIIF